jgi:DNA primase
MRGLIPDSFIDELLARVDIVDVIERRVPLKKAGREWTACCPFHNERTPSFYVSPAKQFFHCFGCGAHGSAVKFLMDYERLEFPDAIEELAQTVGLKVPREGGREAARAKTRPICIPCSMRSRQLVRGRTAAQRRGSGVRAASADWMRKPLQSFASAGRRRATTA